MNANLVDDIQGHNTIVVGVEDIGDLRELGCTGWILEGLQKKGKF
jgi:hypothetical protein